ncbi:MULTISPECIES: YIP1 family protein [Acidobacterium]|nr:MULTISPECIES: YIP1 family protein [Acidobacterium]HCT59662.1 YIP1 family protein [Acidobacterium sp.]
MSDATMVPNAESPAGLSQIERVIDTFTAPGKTFEDIRRSASWWLPWLLAVIVGLGFSFSVQSRVGWAQVYDNILHQSPKQMQRFDQMKPEQEAAAKNIAVKSTQISAYAFPVLGLLIAAIVAGVLMATINFGFGGKATFGQMFAVYYYAGLPLLLKYILAIITLYAGLDPTAFNMKNPVGTNLGYYLGTGTPAWLTSLASSLDIFSLWTAILLVIGCAAVGRVKKSSAAVAIFGWWFILIALSAGSAAIF